MKTAPIKLAISCILAAFTLIITSCGGGSSSNTPPPPTVTVSISGQPASLVTGATASITATVSNGGSVTWTVSCTTSPCGSFSPTSTASGAATTYTAPSSVQSVTITATATSDTTKSATATISVTAPPISVTLSPAQPGPIAAGATANLTATVTNDSQNKGVTWTVTCSNSGACGSFNPTSTASGSATVYTAPAAVPSSGTVTVTATSVTDTTKTATATITITAPGITVALNPAPPSSMIAGMTANLTAVVSNDSQSKGVTWTVTCANSGTNACGSFNPPSNITAPLTTVYTAPTTVPNPNTVKVTATSVTDTTKSASATITVNPILANGTYVYHVAGYDITGPAFTVGAFTVANNVITGGEVDYSDAALKYPAVALTPATCSLSVSGNNIQVVIGTGTSGFGVKGAQTLRGNVVSSSRILITEFDTFATGGGSIDAQTTPVAPLSNGYAFETVGWDFSSNNQAMALALGGILNISGSTLNVAGSIFDFNEEGSVGQGQLFGSTSSISSVDQYGRVSISLVPANTAQPGIIFTGYIVSPTQIQLVEAPDTLGGDLAGSAIGQGSNTGKFTPSLSNSTFTFATYGEDVVQFPATFGGTLIFGSSGAVTGTLVIQDGTNSAVTPITSGSYTVDPTGRATVSNLVTNAFPTDKFSFQLYLDGNGNGVVIGVDANQFTAGQAWFKTATAADFEGNYALSGRGIIFTTGTNAQTLGFSAAGPISVASDNITGNTDYNNTSAQTSAVALTGTENSGASPSTMNIVGLDSLTPTASRQYTYFPIDGKRIVAFETDNNQIGLLTIESH